jgi:hypothetical protein
MDNNLINIKQNWDESIKSYMTSKGFEESDDGFICTKLVRQPGQTISINGRVMQQPGEEIEIKNIVCFIGDGWVANMDDTNKKDFSQVIFKTYQNNALVFQYEDMFYWDDLDCFYNILNKVFK